MHIGCGSSLNQGRVVERVKVEAAGVLEMDERRIGSDQPFSKYGASEFEVAQIVYAVELAFQVQVPREAAGLTNVVSAKALSARKLASLVSQAKRDPLVARN